MLIYQSQETMIFNFITLVIYVILEKNNLYG